MTRDEMISIVKTLTGESDETLIAAYLSLAQGAVRRKAFPYGTGEEVIPSMYDDTVINITVYLYNKAGAEGETVHNENGVNRSYASADIPYDMLKYVVPRGVALSGGD